MCVIEHSLYWFHALHGPKHKNFIALFSSRVVDFVFYQDKIMPPIFQMPWTKVLTEENILHA